jgi:hypothetical protein
MDRLGRTLLVGRYMHYEMQCPYIDVAYEIHVMYRLLFFDPPSATYPTLHMSLFRSPSLHITRKRAGNGGVNSAFARIPAEIWQNIYDILPSASRLALRCTSRFLRSSCMLYHIVDEDSGVDMYKVTHMRLRRITAYAEFMSWRSSPPVSTRVIQDRSIQS